MKVIISPRDNVVTKDGIAKPIATNLLPQNILSITFDTTKGSGAINTEDGSIVALTSLAAYASIMAAYDAWAPTEG